MRTFISWSGNRSKKVATLLAEWLPIVTNGAEFWLSTRDIDSGAQWFAAVTGELADTNQGVFCITSENKDKPWILFEAGALSKGSSAARVRTVLIDVLPSDIEDPLARIQHTNPKEKESMLALVVSINRANTETPLTDASLRVVFDAKWEEFKIKFDKIIEETTPQGEEITSVPQRDDSIVLSDVLDVVRNIDKRFTEIQHSGASMTGPTIERLHAPTAQDVNIVRSKLYALVHSLLENQHFMRESEIGVSLLPTTMIGFKDVVLLNVPELLWYYGEIAFNRALTAAVNEYYSSKGNGKERFLSGSLRFAS